jgi:hypothetical protein
MGHKLNLDFNHQPNFALSSWSWLSLSILFVSLLLAMFTWQTFNSKQAALEKVTTKLTQINGETKREKTPVALVTTTFSQVEIKQLEETINILSTPWNKVLSEIEHANQTDIALLSIQPSIKKQTLLLSGEAKNLPAVLSYIKQLEAQPMLEEVYLQKHSTNEANVSKPIMFTIFSKLQFRNISNSALVTQP